MASYSCISTSLESILGVPMNIWQMQIQHTQLHMLRLSLNTEETGRNVLYKPAYNSTVRLLLSL